MSTLSMCVMKALESPNQEIYSLSSTARDAREELELDARSLHPDFAAVVQVKPATGRIRFANGSQIHYLGGDIRRLEQLMRGTDPTFVGGISRLPWDLQQHLQARMAR
jgi:hypothetical protein